MAFKHQQKNLYLSNRHQFTGINGIKMELIAFMILGFHKTVFLDAIIFNIFINYYYY